MKKEFNENDLIKPATYKQQWAVAYKYAESLIGDYPDLSEKQLVRLI